MQISLLSHCSYYIVIFNLWFDNWWSLLLSISSNRFFQKRNGLSDRRVVSMTKIEYSFAAHFLYSSMKSLESMPIFMIKNVVFSLTSFGTGKTAMNTKKRFSFQSLINNSSEVIYYKLYQQSYHQTPSEFSFSFLDYTLQYCCRHLHIIWVFLEMFQISFFTFLWDTDYSIRMDPWHTKRFCQCLIGGLLDWVRHSFFLIQSHLLSVFCMDRQEFVASLNCVPVYFLP